MTFGADLLKTNRPASLIYDINDVCGGKVHAFHENVLTQQARCNLDDSGWIVILRRESDIPQPVYFNRSWNEYVHGFGDLNTEFWYGLRNIHCLTSRQEVDLQLLLNLPMEAHSSGLTAILLSIDQKTSIPFMLDGLRDPIPLILLPPIMEVLLPLMMMTMMAMLATVPKLAKVVDGGTTPVITVN